MFLIIISCSMKMFSFPKTVIVKDVWQFDVISKWDESPVIICTELTRMSMAWVPCFLDDPVIPDFPGTYCHNHFTGTAVLQFRAAFYCPLYGTRLLKASSKKTSKPPVLCSLHFGLCTWAGKFFKIWTTPKTNQINKLIINCKQYKKFGLTINVG